MAQYALLTLFGRDRTGIVAQVARVLYETGCNIEDSSMIRLRGEFTVMLILRLPDTLSVTALEERLVPVTDTLALTCQIKSLGGVLGPTTRNPEQEYSIHLAGADQTGIVYRVATALAEEGANITDMVTMLVGHPQQPIYTMMIEVELDRGAETLKARLDQLAGELKVDITIRPSQAYSL